VVVTQLLAKRTGHHHRTGTGINCKFTGMKTTNLTTRALSNFFTKIPEMVIVGFWRGGVKTSWGFGGRCKQPLEAVDFLEKNRH